MGFVVGYHGFRRGVGFWVLSLDIMALRGRGFLVLFIVYHSFRGGVLGFAVVYHGFRGGGS